MCRIREGDRILNNSDMIVQGEKISVIVRTIGRPEVLQQALESLRKQTYRNFEVVIVEDGPEVSRTLLQDYPDLMLRYFSTGVRSGRTQAGNIGLKMTCGKYLIFLDDDDIFFPNHLEILQNSLNSHSSYKAAYSIAYEVPTLIKSYSPFQYTEKKYFIHYAQPFNRLLLFYKNYIPIQSVLFKRELYERYGGFDESLNTLEDWDLWIRYSLENDFLFVPEITSKYRVPASPAEYGRRTEQFDNAVALIRKKQNDMYYTSEVFRSVEEIEDLIEFYKKEVAAKVIWQTIRHPTKILKEIRGIIKK
jgi:glycosyltransferase involved in cell wall biosynthesis